MDPTDDVVAGVVVELFIPILNPFPPKVLPPKLELPNAAAAAVVVVVVVVVGTSFFCSPPILKPPMLAPKEEPPNAVLEEFVVAPPKELPKEEPITLSCVVAVVSFGAPNMEGVFDSASFFCSSGFCWFSGDVLPNGEEPPNGLDDVFVESPFPNMDALVEPNGFAVAFVEGVDPNDNPPISGIAFFS